MTGAEGDAAASDVHGDGAGQRNDRLATSEKPPTKAESRSRVQNFTAVAALAIGLLSLGLSTWAATQTLEYSRLTSKPHVEAYLTGVKAVARGSESNRHLIYCEADVRLVNTGGAGAILESVDVTARIGSNSQTQSVDAVREYTDAVGAGFVGTTLFTSYALGDTFPVLVAPYGVAEIVDLTAELEDQDLNFLRTPEQYVLSDATAIEVTVSFRLHFADGSELLVPEQRCTYAQGSA